MVHMLSRKGSTTQFVEDQTPHKLSIRLEKNESKQFIEVTPGFVSAKSDGNEKERLFKEWSNKIRSEPPSMQDASVEIAESSLITDEYM